ncbi:MAG: TM0106 family RecB-like putative nuclease [Bacteroidota bacterium]
MNFTNNILQLVATDLSNHLSCRHLTELNRKVVLGELEKPYWTDPQLEILIQRGRDHEKAYVNFLKASGKTVAEGSNAVEAMQQGVDAIVQARLELGNWMGIADILVKVPGKSKFGDWQYEVQDTKLAQNTKAGTILQLCLYSDLLADLQGVEPEKFHVIKPIENFEPESYRFDDFKAYYRLTKRNFEHTMSVPARETYPEPAEHCGVCSWWKVCDTRRHGDDYISLVAGIRSSQIEELKTQGVRRLEDFANLEKIAEPKRGNIDGYIKRQQQAKVQLEGRIKNQMIHRVIEQVEEGLGLNRLPEPNTGDVYFDIEGDVYYPSGGLEYLLGYAYRENGTLVYKKFLATNRIEEKTAFASFMKFLTERRIKFPDFNIYHFAPYESVAVKRLASVHSIYEQDVDELLRAERFIDLHAAFKESILASVERYSLKDLEKFTTYTRVVELRDASIARKNVEVALELNAFSSVSKETIATLEGYNQDDCLATEALHVWLEKLRGDLIKSGVVFKRPFPKEEEPKEELKEREKQSLRLYESLIMNLSPDREERTDEEQAKWLLAHQLNYFRREDKSAAWEYFRLQKMEDEDAIGERKAITGLNFLEAFSAKKSKLPLHKYSFPQQEVGISEGDKLIITNSKTENEPFGITFGTVTAIDLAQRTITVKKTNKSLDIHPKSVHINDMISAGTLWTSIMDLARAIDEDGLSHKFSYRASKDLLMRRKPKLLNGKEGAELLPGEDVLAAAIRISLNLDKSILPIQGPPGAGKTTTAAKMIVELLKHKKKIGVTAISHRVVINLFEKVKEVADQEDLKVEFAHRGDDLDYVPEWLEIMKNTDAVLKAIEAGRPVGGTAWLWAADSVVDKLDYLFVDEAGQMSLSQALSASRSAKNIILLGDPQQLEQPQKGSHPEGSDIAALTHLIGDHQAMPTEQGLFLGFTYRLHPNISAFTSELFYEGKLKSSKGLEKQVVSGGTQFDGAGLFYVPVNHVGNQNVSLEEIEEISKIADQLLTSGSWTDKNDVTKKLTKEDILVVAPYNAQVAALTSRLPGIKVGTVDKFQGQEAPIVIYSMTSSSQEDAPRGMNFLFSPNRLNVATSRAKSVSILVASPRLLEPDCKTVDQMKWANGLCRYVEMVK